MLSNSCAIKSRRNNETQQRCIKSFRGVHQYARSFGCLALSCYFYFFRFICRIIHIKVHYTTVWNFITVQLSDPCQWHLWWQPWNFPKFTYRKVWKYHRCPQVAESSAVYPIYHAPQWPTHLSQSADMSEEIVEETFRVYVYSTEICDREGKGDCYRYWDDLSYSMWDILLKCKKWDFPRILWVSWFNMIPQIPDGPVFNASVALRFIVAFILLSLAPLIWCFISVALSISDGYYPQRNIIENRPAY